jgi:hypothetical protein
VQHVLAWALLILGTMSGGLGVIVLSRHPEYMFVSDIPSWAVLLGSGLAQLAMARLNF